MTVIIDLLVTLALATTGYLCVRLLLKEASWLEILSLTFPLGSGLLTWLFFLLGWIGIPFDRIQVIVIWIGVNLVLLALIRYQKNESASKRPSIVNNRQHTAGVDYAVLLILGAGLVISIILSIGRSYSVYDGIAMWAPKGYGIALERSLWGARWGNHGYAYPLNIHFNIASFRLFSGDLLPGSKMIFPLYFFSMLLGIYAFWIREQVHPYLRACSLLVIGTVPVLFSFSMIGYANLPMAAYMVLATLWGIEGIMHGNFKIQILSGILLGLTAWTILEGMLYVVAIGLVLILARYVSKIGEIKPFAWITPVVIIAGVWFVFFQMHGSTGSQAISAASKMLQALLQGDWQPSGIRLILWFARRNIFDISTWGLIYPLGILFFLLGWKQVRPGKNFVSLALFLATLATGALSLGLFYLRSFDIPGLYDLLVRGFPRSFMSPSILFFVLGVQLLAAIPIMVKKPGLPHLAPR